MTSTNDGKDVKSNKISDTKGKYQYIELFKFLESQLSGEVTGKDRTQFLCEAWHQVHVLCLHSTAQTHVYLLAWIQRHTASCIFQDKWREPQSKDQHDLLIAAIDDFIKECQDAASTRNGAGPLWENELLERAEWFKSILSNPWEHPVLKALLNPSGEQPTEEEVVEWVRQERGMVFVTRVRHLAASGRLRDLALLLVAAVMDRARPHLYTPDTHSNTPDPPPGEASETDFETPRFADVLKNEAGFTIDLWELLADIEFMLLHKGESRTKCIELAKQSPLLVGTKMVERLRKRLEKSPREKKIWKNAKDAAVLIAQVVIARCMVIPVCSGDVRVALHRCAKELVRLLPPPRLPPAAAALAAPAATACHLHTLAKAAHSECDDEQKSFVCELYVRAITVGMNELENLKLKTDKQSEARSSEEILSTWFTQLSTLLKASTRLSYECVLTAFSVHPSPPMFELVKSAPAFDPIVKDIPEPESETNSEFGSWATDSRTQTNFVKTSKTLNLERTQKQANILSTAIFPEGEALGLGPELCQDLAVLLSVLRVKTLSWDMNRELLLENCKTYMERTCSGTRVMTRELKFLNLDPKAFQHLREEVEDENDIYYGIEKGYEHLVEFQETEESWKDPDFEDPERTESCSSTNMEELIPIPRRKKRTKHQKYIVQEIDPLSFDSSTVVNIKKERSVSNERSKDRSKEKHKHKNASKEQDKVDTIVTISDIQTGYTESVIKLEKDQRKRERKKERKERKKREKFKMQHQETSSPLSCILDMAVTSDPASKESLEKRRKEIEWQNLLSTASDYDSLGKSSLELPLGGNDDNIIYDGLYSIDETKFSLKCQTSSYINKPSVSRKDEIHTSSLYLANSPNASSNLHNFQIKPVETDGPESDGIDKYYPEKCANKHCSQEAQNIFPQTKINYGDTKKSLKNLLEFRRQKNYTKDYSRNVGVINTPIMAIDMQLNERLPILKDEINVTSNKYRSSATKDLNMMEEKRESVNRKVQIGPRQVVSNVIKPDLHGQKSQKMNVVNNDIYATHNKYPKHSVLWKDLINPNERNNFKNVDAKTSNSVLSVPNENKILTNMNKTYEKSSRKHFEDNNGDASANVSNMFEIGQKEYHDFLKQKYSLNLTTQHSEVASKNEVIKPKQTLLKTTHNVLGYSLGQHKPHNESQVDLSPFPPCKVKSSIQNIDTNASVSASQRQFQEFVCNSESSAKLNCVQQLKQQRKPEHAPTTFSRLSYMHKNKQSNRKNKKSFDPILNDMSFSPDTKNNKDEVESLEKNNKLQSKGKILVSRIDKSENKDNVTKVPVLDAKNVDRVQVPLPATAEPRSREGVTLSNWDTKINQSSVKNVNEMCNLPVHTLLTNKDKHDLHLLALQKSKLNTYRNQAKIENSKIDSVHTSETFSEKYVSDTKATHHGISEYKQLQPNKATLPMRSLNSTSECKQLGTSKSNLPTRSLNMTSTMLHATLSKPTCPNTIRPTDKLNELQNELNEHNALKLQRLHHAKGSDKPSKQSMSTNKPKPEWAIVIDELLAHRTPSRNPSALDIALRRTSFKKESNTSSRNIKSLKSSSKHNKKDTNTACNDSNKTNVTLPSTDNKEIPGTLLSLLNTEKRLSTTNQRLELEHKNITSVISRNIDPFISGIPNSDYDLLEELMDDDLRKEIGELSSDEEQYQGIHSPLTKIKDINRNKDSVHTNTVTQKFEISTINQSLVQQKHLCSTTTKRLDHCLTKHNVRNNNITLNPNPHTLANELIVMNSRQTTTPRSVATNKDINSLVKYRNSVPQNVDVLKMLNTPCSPDKRTKSNINVINSPVTIVNPGKVVLTSQSQQKIVNNGMINSDLVYNPTPAIKIQNSPRTTPSQNIYDTEVPAPNLALFQSSQFAAPVFNPIIIGNAITSSISCKSSTEVLDVIPKRDYPIHDSDNSGLKSISEEIKSVASKYLKDPEKNMIDSKEDEKLCNKNSHKNYTNIDTKFIDSTDILNGNKSNKTIQTQIFQSFEKDYSKTNIEVSRIKDTDDTKNINNIIFSNNICERKVLSQVPELPLVLIDKNNSLESIKNTHLVENVNKKEVLHDQERIRKKRTLLLNRQINHYSFGKPIPLIYIPIKQSYPDLSMIVEDDIGENGKNFDKENNCRNKLISNIDQVPEITKNVISENCQDRDNCERLRTESLKDSNEENELPCRMLLRSSNSNDNLNINESTSFKVKPKFVIEQITSNLRDSKEISATPPTFKGVLKNINVPHAKCLKSAEQKYFSDGVAPPKLIDISDLVMNNDLEDKQLSIGISEKDGFSELASDSLLNRDNDKFVAKIKLNPSDHLVEKSTKLGSMSLQTSDVILLPTNFSPTHETDYEPEENNSLLISSPNVTEQLSTKGIFVDKINNTKESDQYGVEKKNENTVEVDKLTSNNVTKEKVETTNSTKEIQKLNVNCNIKSLKQSHSNSVLLPSSDVSPIVNVDNIPKILNSTLLTQPNKLECTKEDSQLPTLKTVASDTAITKKVLSRNTGKKYDKKIQSITISDNKNAPITYAVNSHGTVTLNEDNQNAISNSKKDFNTLKEKVVLEELPSQDPLIKKIRLKLPDKNVFIATISGKLKVDVDTLFNEPSMRMFLSQTISELKSCTVNVDQVQSRRSSKEIKLPVKEITYSHKPITEVCETIDLVSDDDEEVDNFCSFKTQFGVYKIGSTINARTANLHQNKFKQKCVVKIRRCKVLHSLLQSPSPDITHIKSFKHILSPPNISNKDMCENFSNVIEINESSSESECNDETSDCVVIDKRLSEKSIMDNDFGIINIENSMVANNLIEDSRRFCAENSIDSKLNQRCVVNLVQCDNLVGFYQKNGDERALSEVFESYFSDDDLTTQHSPSLLEKFDISTYEILSSKLPSHDNCNQSFSVYERCDSDWLITKATLNLLQKIAVTTAVEPMIVIKHEDASVTNTDIDNFVSCKCVSVPSLINIVTKCIVNDNYNMLEKLKPIEKYIKHNTHKVNNLYRSKRKLAVADEYNPYKICKKSTNRNKKEESLSEHSYLINNVISNDYTNKAINIPENVCEISNCIKHKEHLAPNNNKAPRAVSLADIDQQEILSKDSLRVLRSNRNNNTKHKHREASLSSAELITISEQINNCIETCSTKSEIVGKFIDSNHENVANVLQSRVHTKDMIENKSSRIIFQNVLASKSLVSETCSKYNKIKQNYNTESQVSSEVQIHVKALNSNFDDDSIKKTLENKIMENDKLKVTINHVNKFLSANKSVSQPSTSVQPLIKASSLDLVCNSVNDNFASATCRTENKVVKNEKPEDSTLINSTKDFEQASRMENTIVGNEKPKDNIFLISTKNQEQAIPSANKFVSQASNQVKSYMKTYPSDLDSSSINENVLFIGTRTNNSNDLDFKFLIEDNQIIEHLSNENDETICTMNYDNNLTHNVSVLSNLIQNDTNICRLKCFTDLNGTDVAINKKSKNIKKYCDSEICTKENKNKNISFNKVELDAQHQIIENDIVHTTQTFECKDSPIKYKNTMENNRGDGVKNSNLTNSTPSEQKASLGDDSDKTVDSTGNTISIVYKNSDVFMGSVYGDILLGTGYGFPLINKADDFNTIRETKEVDLNNTTYEDSYDNSSLILTWPKNTYIRQCTSGRDSRNKRNLKRKIYLQDYKLEKKYRKGKNIDYPKMTSANICESSYSKEYKQVFDYFSSIKFSYSRPFHKEHIDVPGMLKCWPIENIYSAPSYYRSENEESSIFIESNNKIIEPFDPLQKTFTEEILTQEEEPQNLDLQDDTSFSMGFGEGSDRVIQNSRDGNDISKISAATLSDVKQYQPCVLFECNKTNETSSVIQDQVQVLRRFFSRIEIRDKVRSFFRETTMELNQDRLKHDNKKYGGSFTNLLYDLTRPDFLSPAPIANIVHVVQVGQLPVSAAAQNPITCDPRVTPVSNASPSQCLENSPNDEPQSAVKTEYTELTTANLALPLGQEYDQNNQIISMEPQENSNAVVDSDNICISQDSFCKSETSNKFQDNTDAKRNCNEKDDLQYLINKHINNVTYSYSSNDNDTSLESEPHNTIFEQTEKHSSPEAPKLQDNTGEKRNCNEKDDLQYLINKHINNVTYSYNSNADDASLESESHNTIIYEQKEEHNSSETYKLQDNDKKNCNEKDDLQYLINKHINNVTYSYNSKDNDIASKSESHDTIMFERTEKHSSPEPPIEQHTHHNQQNGPAVKMDQIAHAMNAAGITMNDDETDTEYESIVSQNTCQGVVDACQTSSVNNYGKSPSITALALQQALAQILPPPLNQPNSIDSTQQTQNTAITSQVLHIVQGKNTSGNQITIVDNPQSSVINTANSTPVLHIIQNNASSGGSTSQTNTNSFSGLSLLDTGIQQGGNQLLHIVNTGTQKSSNSGQLLKRVNLLTNLTNVQGSNEQKMVQFVCKSADGKSIQLNAPHQRSMVLRLQPIESTNASVPKISEDHDSSPPQNSTTSKDANSQQEIKSRSVYEENYAKFIQNSSHKTSSNDKSTSLPKFNQAFGKQVFQDNQKSDELSTNNSHLSSTNSNTETLECQPTESTINLDHISQINSSSLLLRKSPTQTSQEQPSANIVQQLKPTIAPMNIQTVHGGVIYTRQIPVNIGGGQTINLITVPSTDIIDETGQKQQSEVKFVTQGEGEPSIIKIIPQNQSSSNTDGNTEESTNHLGVTKESSQNNAQTSAQPILTQMRIKLPMLSKTPQMVSGARVVRPSFFQIQRNVIGGANQPVYQQLVLTAAPPLGQQTIRLPQPQATRQVKVPSENQSSSELQMSSSTLEQLREFDMVLEQVKERSTVQPNSNNSFVTKLHTSTADTAENTSLTTVTPTETTQQVLYSIGNSNSLNVAYINRKPTVTTPTITSFVRSADSSGIVDSPTTSAHVQVPHSTGNVASTNGGTSNKNQPKSTKVHSKSKSRPKASSNPPNTLKLNPVPPKSTYHRPIEDEQTTQRILYILAEYKEQVEKSPDKDKPAPRRRINIPSIPGSSKRKKSSCSSRRLGGRDMSPINGEDTCRTMGSEDSSCGTSQGDCTDSCFDSHSPQDSPRKVARKLTFENETANPAPTTSPRQLPQRNVIVADGQTITVARGTAGKPTTAVLMPANYILPVSMVKGGQQIAIVTNRGPKILTVGGGEGGTTNALLLQRLIGPAGLKPVLARPAVRHVRLPTALQNLQAFNLASATHVQPNSATSPAPGPTPPDLVETRASSSPWADRDSQDDKPDRASSPESSVPWHIPSSEVNDYTYEETVRTENMNRTVLDAIPDRYSPDMEAQRIFDKMFDVDTKKSYIVDTQDDSPRCAYDIDASDCDDKAYQQVVHKKDTSHRLHRVANVSSAALKHKYAILEHELRLQKSLSEECEDLGVDSPSASELFPEAELLFTSSPAPDTQNNSHTPQPVITSSIPQPDMDDQIATDQLLPRLQEELAEATVTVSEALRHEEFARAHPNTTFHSEPTDEGEVHPFTISGLKGRHITSTIFHSSRAPGTVLMTAPQTTVISQALPGGGVQNHLKFANIDSIINTASGQHNILSSVLVKDDGVTKYDTILTDSRELHLSHTASAIVHSTGNATQVIRRVGYDDDKRDARYLIDDPDALLAGVDAKMVAEDNSRDIMTLESITRDVDDGDRSSPERHAELFWESNSASERSESRRPLDFSSDSDKCCKSPSYDETNSTDSSGVGTHMRLDSVIKEARGIGRSASADGSSAEDTHVPLRTYPPKRVYTMDTERSMTGKTRAGERSTINLEVRRRASGRGVVKRGCHCCNGSPAPPRPKKSKQKKNMDFSNN